jgi:hypothetical protein
MNLDLVLQRKKGRHGPTTVEVRIDGTIKYLDEVNLKSAKDRTRFVNEMLSQLPGLHMSEDDITRRLLELHDGMVSKVTSSGGTFERRSGEPADSQGGTADAHNEHYKAYHNGMFWLRESKVGELVWVRLSNFTATIVTEVGRDDGVEIKRQLHIEAVLLGATVECDIMAEELLELAWVMRLLGATAIVEPGAGFQRLGHAIQVLSKPTRRHEYAHSGWARINGQYLFLHSGGAIGPVAGPNGPRGGATDALPGDCKTCTGSAQGDVGPVGPVPNLRVELPSNLKAICFPTPPTGDNRATSLEAVLRLLDVAPCRVMVPLVLAAFRATMGGADFSLFLSGPTGTRKTAVAALVQQLFGADFDANHLPGNFSSTANANEEMLFAAKDVLVVIDDFVAPVGTDRSKFDAHADRIFRNNANGAARQRMRPDGSVKPPRPPRALPLATGEMIPRGQSLRARLIVVEIGPKEVNLDALTASQEDGRSGVLAGAMAAFLQWIAPQLEAVRQEMRKCVVELRKENVKIFEHGRTSSAVAELRFTLDLFMRFASEAGVSAGKLQCMSPVWKHALHEVAMEQNDQQKDADPVEGFLRMVVGALGAGRMHLADASDGTSCPRLSPEMLGWRRNSQAAASGWEQRGERAGYVTDGGDVYLVMEITEAGVRRLAQENGDPLPIGGRLLRKRLHERGLLSETEKRGHEIRLQVRKVIGKQRREVVCMKAGTLWPDIDLSLHRE